MNEEEILTEANLEPEVLESIYTYEKGVIQKLNQFLESQQEGAVLENTSSGVTFRIEKPRHHFYKLVFSGDRSLESVLLSAEGGNAAIEINRPGKMKDEYLGSIDMNPSGGAEIKIAPNKIRIYGSFESFKVRMDKIVDDIKSSIPYTEGS
jgi:hypothetical protein